MREKRAASGSEGSVATVCGSGASTDHDARVAVEASVRAALSRLQGRKPSLGMLFTTPTHDLSAALDAAHALAPDIDFVACSTAGELTERGLTHGGVACMLVAWNGATHLLRIAPEMGADAVRLSESLSEGFDAAVDFNAAVGRSQSISVLLGDGLSPTFEKLVIQMRRTTSPTQQIVGAGAGDEGALSSTKIGANRRQFGGGALAVHVFSHSRWGVGVEHGVQAMTPPMTVTRAAGNLVYELDGTPALEVYRRHAEEHGGSLEGESLGQFLVENQLGVLLFDDIVRVRAPIRANDDGSLFFAGEVPESSSVCIVRSEPAQMFAAAKRAAQTARESLGGKRAAGVLVFSCICRALRLGPRYADEIACVREVFPDLPIAGFCSYGEIARTAAKLDGYHNSTIVVAAIPE